MRLSVTKFATVVVFVRTFARGAYLAQSERASWKRRGGNERRAAFKTFSTDRRVGTRRARLTIVSCLIRLVPAFTAVAGCFRVVHNIGRVVARIAEPTTRSTVSESFAGHASILHCIWAGAGTADGARGQLIVDHVRPRTDLATSSVRRGERRRSALRRTRNTRSGISRTATLRFLCASLARHTDRQNCCSVGRCGVNATVWPEYSMAPLPAIDECRAFHLRYTTVHD